jgi:uncharacterized protein (TIGR02597 family)
MNLPRFSCSALVALLALPAFSASQAEEAMATTDPVGYVSYNVNAQSDQKIGVPMQRASSYSGTASSVNAATVQADGMPALTGNNFLLVTSGTAAGQWEQISTSSAGQVTLASSISGFQTNDTFAVKPFWTLDTLFPNGGAIPSSADPENPDAVVLFNVPAATGVNQAPGEAYLYHAGEVLPAGWYDANTFELANSVTINPESFITIRNSTASPISISFVGSVPAAKMAIDVASRAAGAQDNLVYNRFPTDVTLINSGLASSGVVSPSPDPENPTDTLFVYQLNNNVLNPAPSAAYIYHGGEVLSAGWYDANTFDSADNLAIPAGGAFIIRKPAGANSVISWNPDLPYSLN